jgi:DNA primase
VDGTHRNSELKARVLEATDIVALIGRSVSLKKQGRKFIGLCPFHQEKTPSFSVSPTEQFYYCFGCKKHGNALDFLIERDRIEFKDALRQLAQAAGIAMPEFNPAAREQAGEMQNLRDIQSAACMFFEKQLAHPTAGQAAREYLKNRGFTDESIKRFRIGLAIESWDAFLSSPAAKKFAPAQLALAGLVKPREKGDGYYDTFRNRLMFPIRDKEGRVIAFGGRVMPGSDDKAKYLNSPQTPLFDKGSCAFGLDLAQTKIAETRLVAVVEGYTDVVMAHQFGCTNVVSTLGTALTPRHLSLLSRFADKIVLLFDPDLAGNTAVDRAVELFLTQDKMEIAVASLPDGLDPDEFLLKHGADGFNAILAGAADALSYKWKQLSDRFQARANDLTGQQKAIDEYMAVLSAARQAGHVDPLRWGAALNRASRLTGIPTDQLHRRLKIPPKTRRPAQAEKVAAPKTVFLTARDRAESYILGYLLCMPSRWLEVQKHLGPLDFTDGPRRKLAEIYWQHQQDEGEPVLNQLLSLLDDQPPVKELAVELAQIVQIGPEADIVLESSIEYFRLARLRSEQEEREAQLRRGADPSLAPVDEAAVLAQICEFSKIPDPRRLAVRYGG